MFVCILKAYILSTHCLTLLALRREDHSYKFYAISLFNIHKELCHFNLHFFFHFQNLKCVALRLVKSFEFTKRN